jgi:magnesium transporter
MMNCYEIENDMLIETQKGFEDSVICVCTPDELRSQKLKIAPHTIQECSVSGSARLEAYDGYNFILLNVINEKVQFQTQRLGLYLTPQQIIFVCESFCGMLQEVLDVFLKAQTANLTSTRILYAFFNHLTSHDSDELEALEEEIADLEERVLKGATRDYIKDILAMRKKLAFYKKYYEQLLDVAEGIEENSNGILSPGSLRYFKMFTARVDRLNRNLINLRDYVTQVREAYQSQVDIGLNAIMKLFTVITAIFLPLTLLVGWYGMNFKNMPELEWRYGYLYVVALSVTILVSCLIYFKKKKML